VLRIPLTLKAPSRGVADGANAAANTDLHVESAAGFRRELVDEFIVVALAHGGIKIDDVEPFVTGEAVKQAHDIVDGEFAATAVNQLHGLATLQVNTGNQHASLTSTPFELRNCFSSAMDWTLS